MVDQTPLAHDSLSVHKHLELAQSIISRMAEYSRSCKVWCTTLVSAVLIFVVRSETSEYTFMALIPAIMLLVLDTYYVAQERAFRKSHEGFVKRLHGGKLFPADLFAFERIDSPWKHAVSSAGSFSVWPFYLAVLVMVLLFWWIANL